MVVDTVDFLMQLDPDQSEEQRHRYTHALCAADVDIGEQPPYYAYEFSNGQRYLLKTTDPNFVAAAEIDRRHHILNSPVNVNALVRHTLFLFILSVFWFLQDYYLSKIITFLF